MLHLVIENEAAMFTQPKRNLFNQTTRTAIIRRQPFLWAIICCISTSVGCFNISVLIGMA